MLCAGPACGGVVHTVQGPTAGRVTLGADGIRLDGRTVSWGAAVSVVTDAAPAGVRPAHAVHLSNGERWATQELRVSVKDITIESALLGRHTVERGTAAMLQMAAGPLPREPKAEMLYRDGQEPIPGALLWISEKELAIDSPLGVLTLPREGTVCYRFRPARQGGTPGADRVYLTDGTVLSGAVTPEAESLGLAHAVLGRLALPYDAIRAVRRSVGGAVYLTDRVPAAEDLTPLIEGAAPSHAPTVEPGAGPCLGALVVQPETTLRYALPPAAGRARTLHARLEPVPGARGTATLTLAAGQHAGLTKTLGPSSQAEWVRVELGTASELILKVAFDSVPLFPCGVRLGDPYVGVASP